MNWASATTHIAAVRTANSKVSISASAASTVEADETNTATEAEGDNWRKVMISRVRVLAVIDTETSAKQNGKHRQVSAESTDLGRHLPLGVSANGRQLDTAIAELGCPVRKIGQQLVGHKHIAERGDVGVKQQLATVGTEALRGIRPS